MTKEQKILDFAKSMSLTCETWADLSNALFDPIHGMVTKEFPTREERQMFIKTKEYVSIKKLVEEAIYRFGLINGATPKDYVRM